MRMTGHVTAALCAALALSPVSAPAMAQALGAEAAQNRAIFVPVNKSISFRLDQPATKIVVASPDTAEIVATTDRSFYVRGVGVGSTNLLVYGPGGRLQEVIDVRVGYDAHALEQDLASAFPGEAIKVISVGEGVMLNGIVSNASITDRAMLLAGKFAPNAATSGMTVRASQEVVLEVRVMEATRSALQDVGFSGSITSGNATMSYGSGIIGNVPANGAIRFATHAGLNGIDLQLQALEEKGIVRTLARPNLVAVSGGKASFLAGGEFPFPVPEHATVGSNTSTISIQFKPYGVKLDFQPTVQSNGLIRLAVAPEVSQLDQANGIKIGGVQIPGLITRRVDTTVEIRDGDSLAIGGLFLHDYMNDVRQYPGLGRIPIIGALFRSSRWKRDETELVIIVTPHIITARDFERAANTTTLGEPEPSAASVMLFGKESRDKPMSRDLRGPPGTLPPLAPASASPAQ